MTFATAIRATLFAAVLGPMATAALAAPEVSRVQLADWDESRRLPAADPKAVSDETRFARQVILGQLDPLDADYVRLWWFGVSSFVASINGHLVLFDAWEITGAHKDYVPIGREELAALQPEAIFIGHGHFDHAADAGYVAARSGALIVGSEEICSVVEEDAIEQAGETPRDFTCLITGTETTPAPGTLQQVQIWEDWQEPVTVLQHIHSAAHPQEPGEPFLPVPNMLPYLMHPNTDPDEITQFMRTAGDAQGGTWAYHFQIGDFTLFWLDSAGPIVSSNLPDGPAIQQALGQLPGGVDVQVGAILGFDMPVSGLRDPRLYVEHARPKVFLPQHHDAWAPVIAAGGAQYQEQWSREMEKLPPEQRPLTDFLRDPEDYMKVRAYRVDDPFFRDSKGAPKPKKNKRK